jgi:hypothetical protein
MRPCGAVYLDHSLLDVYSLQFKVQEVRPTLSRMQVLP